MKEKLTILWFCNTPANACEILSIGQNSSGSWLQTLDIEIQSKIDLHIAFYHSKQIRFKVRNTHYYGIKRYNNLLHLLFSKIAERLLNYVRDDCNLSQYLRIVDLVSPDLVHIHGTENSFGCIQNKISVPVVLSIQGLLSEVELFYSKGLGDRKMFVRNFNFKSLINILAPTNFNNAKIKFKKMASIERQYLYLCKYVIGRTFWDKRLTRLLAPNSKYYHIDEIMRFDFREVRWSPPPRAFNLIRLHTTSDNVYYKGLEVVCSAISIMRQYGYSCSWNIAGVNRDDLIVKILAKKFGSKLINKYITFLGKIPGNELVESMLNSDIYVMPSNIENSPNALCEAMLLGMPCIAANTGGVSDFIDETNGILIQPGDSYSLAAVIVELYSNPSKCATISNNARVAAMARHDPTFIATNLIRAYKDILLDRQSSPS